MVCFCYCLKKTRLHSLCVSEQLKKLFVFVTYQKSKNHVDEQRDMLKFNIFIQKKWYVLNACSLNFVWIERYLMQFIVVTKFECWIVSEINSTKEDTRHTDRVVFCHDTSLSLFRQAENNPCLTHAFFRHWKEKKHKRELYLLWWRRTNEVRLCVDTLLTMTIIFLCNNFWILLSIHVSQFPR